jgi:hypothetical protein
MFSYIVLYIHDVPVNEHRTLYLSFEGQKAETIDMLVAQFAEQPWIKAIRLI